MTFADAVIALRRLRSGQTPRAQHLVALRNRGLVRGPLYVKVAHERRVAKECEPRLFTWERVWTISADGLLLLAFVDDALEEQARRRAQRIADARAGAA